MIRSGGATNSVSQGKPRASGDDPARFFMSYEAIR